MEVMTGLARSLRSVASQADIELGAARKKAEKLAECLDQLRQLFKAASQAKGVPAIAIASPRDVGTLDTVMKTQKDT